MPREARSGELLGRRADDRRQRPAHELIPTKDNVLNAINEVMAESGGEGEALYFFFSGHGVTTTYANREESALVFPGHRQATIPSQTLAVRSIAEFFETTRFLDQFFFIDACRSPLRRQPRPRSAPGRFRADASPGRTPPQQFILYATSPGRTARGRHVAARSTAPSRRC